MGNNSGCTRVVGGEAMRRDAEVRGARAHGRGGSAQAMQHGKAMDHSEGNDWGAHLLGLFAREVADALHLRWQSHVLPLLCIVQACMPTRHGVECGMLEVHGRVCTALSTPLLEHRCSWSQFHGWHTAREALRSRERWCRTEAAASGTMASAAVQTCASIMTHKWAGERSVVTGSLHERSI